MSKTKSKQPREFDHAAMIRDPDRWPCWPWLPVKRGDHSLESKNLGLLCCNKELVNEGRPIVYHVYLFAMPKTLDEMKAAPTTEYPTVEAMLADGWVVD